MIFMIDFTPFTFSRHVEITLKEKTSVEIAIFGENLRMMNNKTAFGYALIIIHVQCYISLSRIGSSRYIDSKIIDIGRI